MDLFQSIHETFDIFGGLFKPAFLGQHILASAHHKNAKLWTLPNLWQAVFLLK